MIFLTPGIPHFRGFVFVGKSESVGAGALDSPSPSPAN